MREHLKVLQGEVNNLSDIHRSLLEAKLKLQTELERIGESLEYQEIMKYMSNRQELHNPDIEEYITDIYVDLCMMAGDCDGDMTRHGFYSYQQNYEDNQELVPYED